MPSVKSLFWMMFVAVFFAGCKDHGTTTVTTDAITDTLSKKVFVTESATTGKIRVGIDETLYPMAIQLVNAFTAQYPKSRLEPVVLPENLLYQYLAMDSVRIIFGTRKLNYKEIKRIKSKRIDPKTYTIGTGGVVLLTNANNPVKELTDDQLEKVLIGEITNWSELGAEDYDRDIKIVFDNPGSSVLRQISDTYLDGKSLTSQAFATKSSEQVIKYVSESKSALGLVGFEWICDKDDPRTQAYLDSTQVMALQAPDSVGEPDKFFLPFQSEITMNQYPLIRKMYIHSREYIMGLGTGFAIFSTNDLGQRILLKGGMVPEKMPPRLIILPPKDEL